MDCIRRVALIVNCGYARVCIYQNSNRERTGQSSRQTIDIAKRQTIFNLSCGDVLRLSSPDSCPTQICQLSLELKKQDGDITSLREELEKLLTELCDTRTELFHTRTTMKDIVEKL